MPSALASIALSLALIVDVSAPLAVVIAGVVFIGARWVVAKRRAAARSFREREYSPRP